MLKKEEINRTQTLRTFERVQLHSMIPLTLTRVSPIVPPVPPIETDIPSPIPKAFETPKKPKMTVRLDTEGETQEKIHRITPYVPARKYKKRRNPDPGAYSPQYTAVEPSPLLTSIHDTLVLKPRRASSANDLDVIDFFHRDLRGFNTGSIKNVTTFHEDPPKAEIKVSSFDKQLPRSNEIKQDFGRDFFIPKEDEIVVTDFDKQSDRLPIFKQADARDFNDKAVEQQLKLKQPTSILPMNRQLSRDYQPHKNGRVSFLDRLSVTQKEQLEKLRPSRQGLLRKVPPVYEPFDKQLSRDYGTVRRMSEPRLPLDTDRGLKYTGPRVPEVRILPPSKTSKLKSFYET